MATPLRTPSRSRAFTLIELLTVIAIIGILAAILIPTVGKVRAMAKKSQCVSNLRQWGTAVRLFANDNKGLVALYNKSPEDWTLYSPYFSQKKMMNSDGVQRESQVVMSRCPGSPIRTGAAAQERDYAFVLPLDANKPRHKKTGAFFNISDTNTIVVYNLTEAKDPSRLFLMLEVYTGHNDEYKIEAVSAVAGSTATVRAMQFNATNPAEVRHGGVANALYVDGHVSGLSLAETATATGPVGLAISQSMRLGID